MSLHPDDVKKIANLAHLALDPQMLSDYTQNLSNILEMVEQMNSVDTKNVEPMAHPLDTHQRLRVDQVTATDQHERFQQIAPAVEADLYLVPQVID